MTSELSSLLYRSRIRSVDRQTTVLDISCCKS